MGKFIKGLFQLALLIFGVFFIIAIFNLDESNSKKEEGPTEMGAYMMSKNFIKEKLKSPSSAEFPNKYEVTVMKTGKRKFEIDGYVDAENSFGAKLRKEYTCVVKKKEHGDMWELLKLEFKN